jgi:hypothetical protein
VQGDKGRDGMTEKLQNYKIKAKDKDQEEQKSKRKEERRNKESQWYVPVSTLTTKKGRT